MEELKAKLAECASLLRKHGEDFWSAKMEALLASHSAPCYFAEEICSWFGGMGSFNDVLLCPENGYPIDLAEVDGVNQRLRSLQAIIYELARRICRECA